MARQKVEIVGAGLAGLAAAIRFAQLGWQVSLHERSADLRMFGAGIWLWESGMKTLSVLGAYDAAMARAKIIKEWRIVDRNGEVLMRRTMVPGDRMLLPPRADLYQALIDRAVATGVEIFTSSVGVDVKPEGVLVLEGGQQRPADLIVVADGTNSRLRESLFATSWIDHGTDTGIRMLIQQQPGDPEDLVTEYWNGPWRLLFNPCTDGQNYIFLGAPIWDERARILPIDRALWREKFPHAAGLVDRFVEDGRWDRIVNVRCRHWSEGRVVIVGDAAHAMPPNLGQAANTAFITVMALALAVTGASDIPTTLRAWEKRIRPLANHVQWWSYIYGLVVSHWPEKLLSLRSDGVRALAKTQWFDEGLNRGARHVPDGYEPCP